MKRSGSEPDSAGRRAGFTLIEALAALAIAAAGFAVIAQFASTAFGNWHRGRDGAAALDMITAGLAQVGRDFGRALPVPAARKPGATMLFRGGPDRIVLVAATGLRQGDGGLEVISIRAVSSGGGRMLVRERGTLSAGLDASFTDPVALMQGALDFRFAFVDVSGRRSATWVDRPTLPARVELELVHPDGRPVLGPPHVFTLPTDYSTECLDADIEKTGGTVRCGGPATDTTANEKRGPPKNGTGGGDVTKEAER